MIDKQDLQKLRQLPIEGVAVRLGLRPIRHRCLCPFHDDHHASFTTSPSRNSYRCWACGASGGPLDLVMNYLHIGFKEACSWLADGTNNVILTEWKPTTTAEKAATFDPGRYERFFEHPWLSTDARRFLFDERRIDPRVAKWCRLTSWRDKNDVRWLQIPYFDVDWRLIGVQNRRLVAPPGSQAPRFKFPLGSRCSIYNLPVLKMLRPGDELYITEGGSDCWSMLSAGHKAIAIPSATILSPHDKELLRSLSCPDRPGYVEGLTFHMYPDQDLPGEQLFLQLKEILPDLVRHQLPLGCKDFSDHYVQLKETTNNEQS